MQQPLAHVCFLMWKGNIWFIMMAMTVLHHQKCIRCNACTIWLYPIICICSCYCQASSMMAHFVWKENHDHYWSNNNVDIWQWKKCDILYCIGQIHKQSSIRNTAYIQILLAVMQTLENGMHMYFRSIGWGASS